MHTERSNPNTRASLIMLAVVGLFSMAPASAFAQAANTSAATTDQTQATNAQPAVTTRAANTTSEAPIVLNECTEWMGILVGYLVGTLWPNFMNASNPGVLFMMAVAVVFSFAVAYIAHRGVVGATSVNIAINVIQISALVVFAVMALGYRSSHPAGSPGWQFDSNSGEAYTYEFATEKTMVSGVATDTVVRDAAGVPKAKLDAAGKGVPFLVAYPEKDDKGNFLSHGSDGSVVGGDNLMSVL